MKRRPLVNPARKVLEEAGGQPDAIWKVSGMVAGLIGAIAGRKLIDLVRSKRAERGDLALNPADERLSWSASIAWAGAIGLSAAAGRLLAQVVVAEVWKMRRHRPVADMPA